MPPTFPTGNPKGTEAKGTSQFSIRSPILGAPASAPNSPGKASGTSPTQHGPSHIPAPPQGQTRLQAPSSPAAPCGGASGGGGTHPSCGTPGGISSQTARRTPSPRPLPPPACAARGEQDRLRHCSAAHRETLGWAPAAPLPPALHDSRPAPHQRPPGGNSWEGHLEEGGSEQQNRSQKIRRGKDSPGCGDPRSQRGQVD